MFQHILPAAFRKDTDYAVRQTPAATLIPLQWHPLDCFVVDAVLTRKSLDACIYVCVWLPLAIGGPTMPQQLDRLELAILMVTVVMSNNIK